MDQPAKRPCPHGRAREQVLQAVKDFGPCRFAVLKDFFDGRMHPVTIKRWLSEFQKLGTVAQVRKGTYVAKGPNHGLHRLQIIAATQPAKLEVLKALCLKGRPVSPTELATQCHARHGDRLKREYSSFYRMVTELRRAGIVQRVPKYADGKHLSLDPQWVEDLHSMGYVTKKPAAPMDPELQSLLS